MREARRGMTLMELTLVLAIVVVLAALALPAADYMLANNRVTSAQDAVRARWSEARAHAQEEHRAYRFAVKMHGNEYRIAPDTREHWEDSDLEDFSEQTREPFILVGKLPERVVFCEPKETVSDNATPNAGWHTVVTFQADGTAREDAEIGLFSRGARAGALRLNAQTGTMITAAISSDAVLQ